MPPQTKINRRRFLATATTATIATPLLLPASIWAAEAGAKPNERITMGFIGVGTQGRGLLSGFLRHPNTQVVAISDVDTTRREHSKKTVEEYYATVKNTEFKDCTGYPDFRDVLARKDIDAVVIATPDHWHAFVAVSAANKGKDIYCEKPLSLTIHEARTMVKAARKNDRVFQTGSMQRSSSEFHKACELVRNGKLGKIKTVIVGVGPSSKWCDLPEEPMEPGLDWDRWLGPAPLRPYNSVLSPRGVHKHFPDWRNYREYSGGMMTDWGAHHFDIAQWGLGMDESGPVEIIPPDDANARTGLRYLYANGVEMIHDSSKGGVTFIGERGKIFVDRGKFQADPEEIGKETIEANGIHLYKSDNHLKDFLDCVRSRKRPICDVEVGCRSVTVCHLGNLAYWNHRRLKWDPAKEQFIGDAEANGWLDRVKRGGWKV